MWKYCQLFVLYLLFINTSIGQTIQQGEFEFGIISYSLPERDSTEFNNELLLSNITNEINYFCVFDTMRIAYVKLDSTGVLLSRSVYSFNDNLVFKYFVDGDDTYFMIDSISEDEKEVIPNEGMTLIKNQIKLREKYLSFNQDKSVYQIDSNQTGIVEIYSTDNIILLKGAFHLNTFNDNFLLRRILKYDNGLKMEIGVKQFSENIHHPEWLSVSINGFKPIPNVIKSLFEAELSSGGQDESEEEVVESGNGVNLDVLNELNQEGFCKKDKMLYDLDYYNENNYSLDFPGLISNIDFDKADTLKSSKDKLISILKKNDLFTKSMENLLKDYDLKDVEKYQISKSSMMTFLSIIEHLKKREVKLSIVENLLKSGFKVVNEKENTIKYLNGGIDLSEYMMQSESFFKLKRDSIFSQEQLSTEISKSVKQILSPELKNITTYQKEDSLLISVNNIIYRINTIDFWNFHKLRVDLSDKDSKKFLNMEDSYYGRILTVVNQIAIDNSLDIHYGLYKFDVEMGSTFTYSFNYFWLDRFGDRKYRLFKHDYALVKIKNRKYNNTLIIPVSFDFKVSKFASQIYIRYPFYDHLSKIISTKEKMVLYNHLKKERDSYKLSDTELSEVKRTLEHSRFSKKSNLIFLHPSSFSIISYPKLIDPTKNSFKEVYPKLSKFFKSNFDADNIRFTNRNKISFDYKGNSYTCGKSEKAVLEEVLKILKMEGKSRYDVYRIYGSRNDTVILYLSNEQKVELEKLINVKLYK